MKLTILLVSLLSAAASAKGAYIEGATADSSGVEAVVAAAKLGGNEAPAANHRRMERPLGSSDRHDVSFGALLYQYYTRWVAHFTANTELAVTHPTSCRIGGVLMEHITLGSDSDMSKAGRGGKLVERQEQKYQMRFHLYMARFLPAKDENGLCDPYIVVKYYGKTLKSSIKDATCNPSWYETIVEDVCVPEPLELAPPITVLVYDYDKLSGDDLIGRFYLPLTQAMLVGGNTPPTPVWSKLMFETPGDVSGEVLATVTMVPDGKKASSVAPNLLPETIDSTVELTVVGLRDMTALPLLGALGDALGLGTMGIPLASPFVELVRRK